MNVRTKLVSLVLFTSFGFLFSFIMYLMLISFENRIELEKQHLEALGDKAQATRMAGSEIFLSGPLVASWENLEIVMEELKDYFSVIDDLDVLPYLDFQLQEAVDTINNMEVLALNQFLQLKYRYSLLIDEFSKYYLFNPVDTSFFVLQNRNVRLEDDKRFLLLYYATNFHDVYTLYDDSLQYTIQIIDEKMSVIEAVTREIQSRNFLIFSVICILIVSGSVLFSLAIANRMSSDTKRIEGSLLKMLHTSDPVAIDVNRNDELGDLARNIESIFEQLILTRDKLVQKETLASLGELVAGVAHEVNTPVGIGVTASSHLMKLVDDLENEYRKKTLTEESFEKSVRNISESSRIILANMNRAADLIRSFKQVAVDQTSQERRWFPLRDFLKDWKRSMKPLYKRKSVKVKINCDESLELHSIPGVLSQILTNLLQNSLIHGFEGKDSGFVNIELSVENQVLSLLFRDDGCGMDSLMRDRIFDPFYTSKRGSGGGSGLGLHVVFNLVNQGLNGNIVCESRPDEGTEFLINFPTEIRYVES